MAVSRGRGRNRGEEEFGTDTRPEQMVSLTERKEKKYIVAVAI